jgi:hypothetical protein
MAGVDAWILDKIAEPTAVFLRDRLGVNHWSAALECLHGAIIGVTVTKVHDIMGDHGFELWFDWFILLAMWWWLILSDRPQLIEWANSENGSMTARITQVFVRNWFTGLVFALVVTLPIKFDRWALIIFVTNVLLWASFYLRAVVMPPPKPREQRFTVRANAS